MAGDWMKVELDLPDKPEVHYMAGALSLDPDAVVGKLLRIWGWFDKHTENGDAHGVTFSLLDRITNVPGFAEVMMLAGWLTQKGHVLSVPNFDRHNGKTAKNRALTAKRMGKLRDADSDDGSVTKSSPEKRREEKNKNKDQKQGAAPLALPDWLDSEVWGAFLKHRGSKFTTNAQQIAIKRLSEYRAAGHDPSRIIETSIANGWKGLFEPKGNGHGSTLDEQRAATRKAMYGDLGSTIEGEAQRVD